MGLWRLTAWSLSFLYWLWRSWSGRYAGAILAGDSDRERAAATLREHYVGGYLSLEEFSHRTESVLTARSRAELRSALSGLSVSGVPMISDAHDLTAQVRSAAQTAVRGAVVVVFTGTYVVFTLALVLVLGVTLLVHGASPSALLAVLVIWLAPTCLLARLWHGRPR